MSKSFVRRVDQLDAVYLDDELMSLLYAQYRKAFAFFPSSTFTRFGSDIDVLFRFIFKYLPLRTLGSTFGQNLFQLQYREQCPNEPHFKIASNDKLTLLAISTTCIPWLWNRLIRTQNIDVIDSAIAFENKFSTVYKVLTLVNFCVFLQKSTYPSVIERIIGIRPLYSAPQEIRSIQDDNVDREFLWHGLSEFLGFVLPLINVHKIKGFMKRTCLPRSYKSRYKKYFLKNHECHICGDIPNFPHTIGCSHVFCYYCIASNLLADPSYLCFDCDVKANGIESLKPLASNRSI